MCWGTSEEGKTIPPEGRFSQISGGGAHTCAVSMAGMLQCWGANMFGQTDGPQTGVFVQASAGAAHSCGRDESGVLTCFGLDGFDTEPENWTPVASPEGSFIDVAAGELNSCAVASDTRILCWGDNLNGQSSPP